MRKSDSLVYSLSVNMIKFIFVYYVILILCGMIYPVYILCFVIRENPKEEIVIIQTFLVSFSVSGMLSSVQYMKRLYKACIDERIDLGENLIKRMGNVIYFLSRPLFSCAFDVIMIFVLLSGMFGITGSLNYVLNKNFLYLCVVISGFIGFSIGKLLDRFEILSNEKVENMMREQKGDNNG